ncbi:MAG TPA: hypothetical protein HPP97_08270 [Desulfuromonadales bacterium]|nr:hypothetical protein [Desulfuromonadales bacterium]
MRPAIFYVDSVFLLCAVAASQAAGDPQQQFAEERRRLTRPAIVANVQPQSSVKPYSTTQRERELDQLQKTVVGRSPANGVMDSLQTVNIDRLKVQSVAPPEYQYEALQTLNIHESDFLVSKEEMNINPTETAVADMQADIPVEDVAPIETAPVEMTEDDTSAEEKAVQVATGHTMFRIIEEESRVVVMQGETP